MEKKMEMYYYQIRINLQLAIQKPFPESLQYTTFLKANSKFIGGFLQNRCSLMFCKILRKKPVMESLYFWRHPRSSPSEVNLRNGVLKICSKFTGEHPCRSAISIKLQNVTPALLFSWVFFQIFLGYLFFFYLGFSFTSIHDSQDSWGRGRGYLFNSSVPLQPALQTLRYQLGDHCRGLTSAHSCQPDSNREPFASGRKSLTTKLRAISSNN